MFAGVHSVILSEDQTKVIGISAKEGEQVRVRVRVRVRVHIAHSHKAALSVCLSVCLL